ASLDSLPDELLLHILGYLPALNQENFQLPTLLSFFFAHPYLFLRTLVCNPRAAETVKSFSMNYGRGVHRNRKPYLPAISDRKLIKSGFKSLDIPSWKAWATDCNADDCDQETLYAAILMRTPNLRTLTVDDGKVPYQTPKWIELLRQSVSGNSFGRVHQFTHLNTVQIRVKHMGMRVMLPLFKLPSLRILAVSTLVETGFVKDHELGTWKPIKWTVPNRTSPIEVLTLSSCFMDTGVLASMVTACQHLKKFSYHHDESPWLWNNEEGLLWHNGDDSIPRARLHYPCLTSALNHHRDSIETIGLYNDVYGPVQLYPGFGMLGDFRSCAKLTHITAPLRAFINVLNGAGETIIDRLPASI
ncbi:uncharacterized protein BDR25DRAFT_162059, partial [Lindgomyces ingoldianus]